MLRPTRPAGPSRALRDLNMADLQAPTRPQTLTALRGEIDRIDDALVDLLEARVATSAAISALKDQAGDGCLKLRPRREAEVVARVTGRARGAPPAMIGHLWRTIMSYGLQSQAPMRLVLHAEAERGPMQDIVRARFGPAAPLGWAASEAEALAVAASDEAVAVIARDGPPDLRGTPLRVFDIVPLGSGVAYAIGRVAPADIVAPDRNAGAGA